MTAAWYREAFARAVREALRSRPEFPSLNAIHAEAVRLWDARWKAAASSVGASAALFGRLWASPRWTLYEVIRLEVQGDISVGRAGSGYRIAWIGSAEEDEHLTEAELAVGVREQAEWEAAHVA